MKNLKNKKAKQDVKPSIMGINHLFIKSGRVTQKRCLNNLNAKTAK